MPRAFTVCNPVKNLIFASVFMLATENGLRSSFSLWTLTVTSVTFWLRSSLYIDNESTFLMRDSISVSFLKHLLVRDSISVSFLKHSWQGSFSGTCSGSSSVSYSLSFLLAGES